MVEAGNPLHYLFHPGPPGQGYYLFSKFIGFIAVSGAITQLLLGFLRLQVLGSFVVPPSLHRFHAYFLLILVLLHPILFFVGVSIRSGDLALGLFLPNFTDYFHSRVSLGLIGLWGVIGAGVLGVLGKYMPSRSNVFRVLHYFFVLISDFYYCTRLCYRL